MRSSRLIALRGVAAEVSRWIAERGRAWDGEVGEGEEKEEEEGVWGMLVGRRGE